MEELTREEMRKDILQLMDDGYEMALPDDLFDVAKKEIKNGDKLFLILNSNYQHQPFAEVKITSVFEAAPERSSAASTWPTLASSSSTTSP